jgi:hypothetical protein
MADNKMVSGLAARAGDINAERGARNGTEKERLGSSACPPDPRHYLVHDTPTWVDAATGADIAGAAGTGADRTGKGEKQKSSKSATHGEKLLAVTKQARG